MPPESNLTSQSVPHPLLFECDPTGQVIWMSEEARAAIGEAPLMQALMEYLRTGGSLRVWPAYTMPDSLLFAAQSENPAESAAPRLADSLLQHYFRLEQAEQRLQELRRARMRKLPHSAPQIEVERQRLARELHTGVGQMLAAIRLQLELIAAHAPNPPQPVQKSLQRIAQLSEEALEQVRGISQRLYPPNWQRLTLQDALQRLWELTGIPQRFAARLEIEPGALRLREDAKVLFYRTAQEALSNIARHSGATQVEMTLEQSAGRVTLAIHDNGRGFDVSALAGAEGLGLRSVQDAAEEIDADFHVESEPGSTTLRISARQARQ